MAWRDEDWQPEPVTQDRRAIVWGAFAVVLLAVAGVIFSLLQ